MRFAEPHVLWALAGVPLLAALLALSVARRRRALLALAEARLLPDLVTSVRTEWRVARAILACGGVVFLVLALARPQWGMSLDPVMRRGVDVVLAFDVSTSMLAEDVAPSRLAAARSAAARLLDELSGDRVAVVAFAGSAARLCPLTLDHAAAKLFIDALSPDLLSEPGTSMATGLEEVMAVFPDEQRRFKTAVLFGDGEDQTGETDAAVRKAAEAGVVVHTVGVGTRAGGPIPLRDARGQVQGYKEDSAGRVVTTRLQEEALGLVAESTGGLYFPATPGGGEIDKIAERIGEMDQREMKQRLLARYEERFQIPLALALLCFGAELLLPERRRLRAAARALGRAAVIAIAAALAAGAPHAASASRLMQEGNEAYAAGNYDEALKLYTQAQAEAPDAAEVQLSIGNVLFKKGDFQGAREAYARAKRARDRALAESAHYNAGTASLAAGKPGEALEEFVDALKLDPEDHEARRNLELALRQLQQQQQQQQQPRDQNDQDRNDKQQQQQSPRSQDQDEKKDDQQPSPGQDRQEQAPPPEDRQQGQAASPEERKEKAEAERILDALRGQDRPQIDPGKQRPPDKRPEKDW